MPPASDTDLANKTLPSRANRTVIAGPDPQLEKAIEVVMKQLEANPPVTPKRPPFPVKVKY